RVAEELIFGADAVTTGAANDIQQATTIARNMVTKWGLSEKLGPLKYTEDEGEVFLGHSVTQSKHMSDDTAHLIDEEVRAIVTRNYDYAEDLLKSNEGKLHAMAQALLKYETIDRNQVQDIMDGRDPRPPAGWDDSTPTKPSGESDATGKSAEEEGSSSKGGIGGPASLH
ncbi:MAG: ATP-dependent metalloprotease, partial [Gammaproteobacteria bacterium]|nr:ATP-dependent metalloprotease [Gammaproteobacteria bacterium]